MSTQQLFIPERIKVGFQERKDTYTGKLSYVIYFDKKGVLRKEKSWESWRDTKIDAVEFDNVPTEGFVLNKGVGGQRQSHGWNARNEYIRVYDPRDFEFEISVANLLFVLRECDCNKGKGLEGKFVYSWQGTELVLLPAASQDYRNSAKFTELQGQGVKAKELIPGASYVTKKQETLVYLGRFDYHYLEDPWHQEFAAFGVMKRHVFWSDEPQKCYANKKVGFVFMNDVKTIAAVVSETPVTNYAKLVGKYHKSPWGSKAVEFFLKEVEPEPPTHHWYSGTWAYEESPGIYVDCRAHYDKKGDEYQMGRTEMCARFGRLGDSLYRSAVRSTNYYHGGYTLQTSAPVTKNQLFVRLESGAQFQMNETGFRK